MAGADLTQISTYLKTKFGPAIINQLPDEVPLRDEFHADKSQSWHGDEVSYPIRVNRSRAVYAGVDMGKLPTAGSQKHEKVHIPNKYVWARVQFSGPAIAAAESNEGAWGRVVSLEMDGMVDALAQSFEFYYWGDGRAVRCLLNGDPGTTTTATVDSPMGIAGATHGNRFVNIDDDVVAISPQGVLRAGGTRKVSNVNADGTSFTVSAAIDAAWADNDFIVKAYGADASITIDNTEYMHAPMGLLGSLDDGTYVVNYHGIDRDQYPVFRTPIISNIGGLSLDVLQRLFDVSSQLGSAKISAMWGHHSVRRAYLVLLETDRRYTGGDLRSPDGGTKAVQQGDITYGGIPFKVAPLAPYGMLFGLDRRHMTRYINTEFKWINEDGNVLSRVTDTDAFEASARCFENTHYERPNAGFRGDDINATVVVAHVM